MKTLLLLNDFSPEAEHALAYTLIFAENLNAKVLICNTQQVENSASEKQLVVAASKQLVAHTTHNLFDDVNIISAKRDGLGSEIIFIPEADFINGTLHQMVLKNNIDLIIKGVSGVLEDIESAAMPIFSKVFCPLLLVPLIAELKPCDKIAYLTDLRYCREEMLRAVMRIGEPLKSTTTVAHISASGLPNLHDTYALQLFSENVRHKDLSNDCLFTNIKDRNVKKAADVLINIMHTNLLAMIFRKFHFNELTSSSSVVKEMNPLPVPLLLFPC